MSPRAAPIPAAVVLSLLLALATGGQAVAQPTDRFEITATSEGRRTVYRASYPLPPPEWTRVGSSDPSPTEVTFVVSNDQCLPKLLFSASVVSERVRGIRRMNRRTERRLLREVAKVVIREFPEAESGTQRASRLRVSRGGRTTTKAARYIELRLRTAGVPDRPAATGATIALLSRKRSRGGRFRIGVVVASAASGVSGEGCVEPTRARALPIIRSALRDAVLRRV